MRVAASSSCLNGGSWSNAAILVVPCGATSAATIVMGRPGVQLQTGVTDCKVIVTWNLPTGSGISASEVERYMVSAKDKSGNL